MPSFLKSCHPLLIAMALGGISPLVLSSRTAHAQYLVPTAITTTIPTGSNNGTRNGSSATTAYVDDVYLSTITFSGTTFRSSGTGAFGSRGQFGTVKRAIVVSNAANINAEFGDQDTNSDGDSNPFVKAGVVPEGTSLTGDPNATRESTDPNIQNPAIASAFSGLSLVEGIDGEANPTSPNFAFDLVFNQGIAADGVTTTPELLFFERGRNSQYRVQVITGKNVSGDFTFSSQAIDVDSSNAAQAYATGIFIDTIEIPTGQELGATGLSLGSFGLSTGQIAYGVRITALNDSGPDLYGAFMSASNVSQFRAGLDAIPEPSSVGLVLGVIMPSVGLFIRTRSRRKRANS